MQRLAQLRPHFPAVGPNSNWRGIELRAGSSKKLAELNQFGQNKGPDGKWVSAGCFKQAFSVNEANLQKWLEARPAMTGRGITIAQALADKMKLSPEQIWWSSSLPYSGAKTTAAVATPSHTIAEAAQYSAMSVLLRVRSCRDYQKDTPASLRIGIPSAAQPPREAGFSRAFNAHAVEEPIGSSLNNTIP